MTSMIDLPVFDTHSAETTERAPSKAIEANDCIIIVYMLKV